MEFASFKHKIKQENTSYKKAMGTINVNLILGITLLVIIFLIGFNFYSVYKGGKELNSEIKEYKTVALHKQKLLNELISINSKIKNILMLHMVTENGLLMSIYEKEYEMLVNQGNIKYNELKILLSTNEEVGVISSLDHTNDKYISQRRYFLVLSRERKKEEAKTFFSYSLYYTISIFNTQLDNLSNYIDNSAATYYDVLREKISNSFETVKKISGWGFLFVILMVYVAIKTINKLNRNNKELSATLSSKEKAENEIKLLNEELEMKVLERTKDLEFAYSELDKQINALNNTQLELHQTNTSLQAYTNQIKSSIRYAKNIQNAILPRDEIIKGVLPESFVFYNPCHIVGGDFYWFTIKNGKAIAACVDCTGHGVPGALMSMIGSNMLKNIVEEKNITSPECILNEMNRSLKTVFSHNNVSGKIVDGMEASICSFDFTTKKLEFSGARRPLIVVKQESCEVIKPDAYGICNETPCDFRFTKKSVGLEPGDYVYMFTDGYTDQFGGENGKRFMKSKFIELINSFRNTDMNEQGVLVEKIFDDWKGDCEQVDDVLVMGFKFL